LPNPETNNKFTKGLYRDLVTYLQNPEMWTFAKNVINSTQSGDQLTLSTESANQLCVNLPYQLIGAIPLDGALWMVFCTDNSSLDPTISGNSEIGIVDTDNCIYTKFSNCPCLNFSTTNPITGAARRNYDCGFNVYWSDGKRNPDRYVDTNTSNVNNLIWIQNCTTTGTPPTTCTTCVNTDVLNCNNIQLAPLVNVPNITLNKSQTAGTLENGTYQVALAYAQNGIKVTDYVVFSNTQAIFSHNNIAGALVLNIQNADTTHFEEMIIAIISYNNGQLVARQLGLYYTTESTIHIDSINTTLPVVSLNTLPLQTPHFEKSDTIWAVNNYLIRSGISERPDFNYQPLANQINAEWVLVQYPEKYYQGTALVPGTTQYFSGNNYSYMSDEQYCFFIRWIYNTGDKSASYHIPGRAYNASTDLNWSVQNTASILSTATSTLPDGGVVIVTGLMGYWQSTEQYPSDQPLVYNANVAGHPEWDLCGQFIRHHKFPDQTVSGVSHFTPRTPNSAYINVLGVQFNNIQPPVDNHGNVITTIVGYEILRGSREGQKSIIAKGIINNMCQYPIYGTGVAGVSQQFGLFQNYPANDLRPDPYLTYNINQITLGGTNGNTSNNWLGGGSAYPYNKNILFEHYSFHSPDTVFEKPFLGSPQLKVYQAIYGLQQGIFETPYKHPMFKVATNFDSILSTLVALLVDFSTITGIAAGGSYNVQLTGTDSMPWTTLIGGPITYPSDATGVLSEAAYVAYKVANIALAAAMLPMQTAMVEEQIYRVIKGLIPAKQYAAQFNGHSYYNEYQYLGNNNWSLSNVNDYQYVDSRVQMFNSFEINNLYRNSFVALAISNSLPAPDANYGVPKDVTRYTISQNPNGGTNQAYTSTSCYYTGLKLNMPSQYGQIYSVKELLISNGPLTGTSTPVLFGGDTYINRYTEKNPMLFFNDWLIDVVEDYMYNYRDYINVPYPGFWIDNYQVPGHLINFASNYRRLDNEQTGYNLLGSAFYVDSGNFYLFCNGVRDFYVESDVNVGFRDYGDLDAQKFYDPYGFSDLSRLFRSDIIKSDPFYKYDYSLSVNKFYTQYISFGQTLSYDYDPILAYSCDNYYPRRVIYSLPQTEELTIDNWKQFLPNNYYDFTTPVRAIKPVSKTGAIFLMDESSPVEFTGVQVLEQGESTTTQITIGDGGLFNQPLQNVVNTEKGINYGNTKSKYSALNTPHGLFWVSQASGKVFRKGETLDEISAKGLKWWFAKYMPSYLLQQFPNYPLYDNPIAGVGMQISYDETNDILYVSKKDYKAINLKAIQLSNGLFYDTLGTEQSIKKPIPFTDTQFFEDCSWTVSYDCKNDCWLSYHSWFPDFSITARNHNITSKNNALWTHNQRTDLFANYYGVQYEMSIEYIINTAPNNFTTLKNIEYYLDTWIYKANGWDRFLEYDNNFDNLIVYNNEQCSGLLNLNPKPANPYLEINYPNVNTSSIDILYGFKERKYRISQFWDITNDRGEYSNAQQQSIITSDNGVDFSLNIDALNYNKEQIQRKKFRGEFAKIFLKKNNPNGSRLQLYLSKSNNQESIR